MSALEIIKLQDFKEIQKLFKRPVFKVSKADAMKQYQVSEHDVLSNVKRPYRKISRDTGRKDTEGNVIRQDVLVDVVRVGISWQDTITETRVGFTLSTPITTNVIWDTESDKEKQLVKLVEKIQNDNKMDYKNKEILRRKLSELEVAEIWYFVETGETKPAYTLRCKIVSPQLGDELYPLFDKNGSLIAFRRDYVLNDGQKDIKYSDVYTDEFEYKYVNRDGWILDPDIVAVSKETGELVPANPVPNIVGKMLINYYQQLEPCWAKVQTMISRHETITSNHGGMNDKFGNPLFIVSGEIQGEIIDNTTWSVMQVENGATAQYAQLASEPQSIKLEQENLEKFIHKMSKTPDISFEQMKGIGNVAGVALELMFLDAHIGVKNEEETFGIGLQRRLNIIKAAIGALIDTSLANEAKTVQLIPVITPYLPKNIKEDIENLTIAKTGGIISTETAVEKNPLVDDNEMEMERMKSDATNELAQPEPKQPLVNNPVK
jgi:SPP1 family phage portal protein